MSSVPIYSSRPLRPQKERNQEENKETVHASQIPPLTTAFAPKKHYAEPISPVSPRTLKFPSSVSTSPPLTTYQPPPPANKSAGCSKADSFRPHTIHATLPSQQGTPTLTNANYPDCNQTNTTPSYTPHQSGCSTPAIPPAPPPSVASLRTRSQSMISSPSKSPFELSVINDDVKHSTMAKYSPIASPLGRAAIAAMQSHEASSFVESATGSRASSTSTPSLSGSQYGSSRASSLTHPPGYEQTPFVDGTAADRERRATLLDVEHLEREEHKGEWIKIAKGWMEGAGDQLAKVERGVWRWVEGKDGGDGHYLGES
jgi:hypothetical protein